MRIEYLSDHVGDMLEDSRAQTRHKIQQTNRWLAERRRAESELRASLRSSWWRRLLRLPSRSERLSRQRIREANRHLEAVGAARAALDRQNEQLLAGQHGEEGMLEALRRELTDEWVCFAGYRNGKGETDLLVVGPNGVWTIEVKYRGVTLHTDGEQWTFEKFDRYGNLVDSGHAADQTGRSWGRQASDPAEALRSWFERNNYHPSVRSAVVIIHDRAELGQIQQPGVDFLTTRPSELIGAITKGKASINHSDQAAMEALVRRDHRFHTDRRRQRADKANQPRNGQATSKPATGHKPRFRSRRRKPNR